MRTRQCLQRAPRTIHERIGMLSYHAIVLPHEGHCDLPERGREPHRATKTLRKLPTMRPKRPNPSPLRERTSINLADVKRQCPPQVFLLPRDRRSAILPDRGRRSCEDNPSHLQISKTAPPSARVQGAGRISP